MNTTQCTPLYVGRHACRWAALTVALLLATLLAGASSVQAGWPQVVLSKDNTPISYEVFGAGEPTLVFVHGWSCDSRYWRAQIDQFSKKYRVVVLDLAGHGHSGMNRETYSMKAFGEDVQAVTRAVTSGKVVLIGHSMGGSVIAEAARLMPEQVIGLIGVDTLDDIETPITRAQLEQMIAPLIDNFRLEARNFVGSMILPATDPLIREWILADMSSAPQAVALSAFEEMMTQYITGEAAKVFEQIQAPVICINGDLWPVNNEANRRHMKSFETIIIDKADHFLMLDRPYAFNQALEQAIPRILRKAAAQ